MHVTGMFNRGTISMSECRVFEKKAAAKRKSRARQEPDFTIGNGVDDEGIRSGT